MKGNRFHFYLVLVGLVLWGCSSPQSTSRVIEEQEASVKEHSEGYLDSIVVLESLDTLFDQENPPQKTSISNSCTHKFVKDSIYLEEKDGIKAFSIKLYTEAFSLSLNTEEKATQLSYTDYLRERCGKYEPIPYVIGSFEKLWYLPKDSIVNWNAEFKIIGNFAELEEAKYEGVLIPYIVIYLKEETSRAEVDSLTQKYQLLDRSAKPKRKFSINRMGKYTIVRARIPTGLGAEILGISAALRNEKIVQHLCNHLASSQPIPVD